MQPEDRLDLAPALSRRDVLRRYAAGAAALALSHPLLGRDGPSEPEAREMRFGLVTYLWGQDLALPDLIRECEAAKLGGVELRTTHRHGVEPTLSAAERAEVKARFADSAVDLVGLGSNERFDHPDPAELARAIEATKAFIRLSHDVGGSGVKVKPDRYPDGVPREKTIEQIAKSLVELGGYASEYGQEIRLEVHGGFTEPAEIAKILDAARHERVVACWNSNAHDAEGEGLAKKFARLRERFGRTAHVGELDDEKYPYPELVKLLVESRWDGWLLLEARTQPPAERAEALRRQRMLFDEFLARAKSGAK